MLLPQESRAETNSLCPHREGIKNLTKWLSKYIYTRGLVHKNSCTWGWEGSVPQPGLVLSQSWTPRGMSTCWLKAHSPGERTSLGQPRSLCGVGLSHQLDILSTAEELGEAPTTSTAFAADSLASD